jgi:hypothetical protein
MNPTFQLIISATVKLIVSIFRFYLTLFYSGFKLIKAISTFFVDVIEQTLNKLS